MHVLTFRQLTGQGGEMQRSGSEWGLTFNMGGAAVVNYARQIGREGLGMNIANWLYQTALVWPGRPAIYEGDMLRCDYSGLLRAVCNRALQLTRTYGVTPGDRVVIFAKNAPEYIEWLHACWWIGATVVPVNCKLHPNEAEWIVRDSGAVLVVTDTGDVYSGAAEVAIDLPSADSASIRAPHAVDDVDLAWLFYTSGTTGKPKGVMLTHANLRQMTLCYATDVDNPRAEDHMLYAAPMSHGAGLYMFAQIRAGGAHLIPTSRGFDSAEIIALSASRGSLVFFAAPTMVKRLIAASRPMGYRGEGIRTIVYGGGPMYANDLDEALELFGPRFAQIYGQGESPMTISVLPRTLVADETDPRWRSRRNSVGIAAAAVEVAIFDSEGKPLPTDETGEICVRGATIMKGYWQNPTATADALRGGWLHTGDLGHMNEEGFIYLTDRSKDVIISGGTNIYPREVEEALLQHDAVSEAAIIGEPDQEWGERVLAYVVLAPGRRADGAELDRWCRQQIAGFKRPKRYVFVPELPKNAYGKILKTELRALGSAPT